MQAPLIGDLIQVWDFETGDLTGFYWQQNAPEVVTAPHPVRAGTYSMRAYHHRYKMRSCATDVILCSDDSVPGGSQNDGYCARQFQFDNIGGEYWIGFSVYIPSDFVIDVEGMTGILFQIHGPPDDCEEWRNPLFALSVNADKWRVQSRWDDKLCGGTDYEGYSVYETPLEDAIGRWTDWVIHIKFSYQEGSGFLKIWKDGALWVDQDGPNCYNDAVGPYPIIGLYKWPWCDDYETNTDDRLYYHDELRIGGADASYEDVAPGGNPLPISPTPTDRPSITPTATSMPMITPPPWYNNCPSDPPTPTLIPTNTPWPIQPTFTPEPMSTCRPTAIWPDQPTYTPEPTPSPYPTNTPWPDQPE